MVSPLIKEMSSIGENCHGGDVAAKATTATAFEKLLEELLQEHLRGIGEVQVQLDAISRLLPERQVKQMLANVNAAGYRPPSSRPTVGTGEIPSFLATSSSGLVDGQRSAAVDGQRSATFDGQRAAFTSSMNLGTRSMTNCDTAVLLIRDVWVEPSTEVSSVWLEVSPMTHENLAKHSTYMTKKSGTIQSMANILDGSVFCKPSRPSDLTRMVWESFGLLAIFWDIIIVPFQAFPLKDNGVLNAVDLLTLIYWTVDVLYSFWVGYYIGDRLEMRPAKIAKHYLQTWFILDLLSVLPEWTLMFLERMNLLGAGLTKVLRVARAMKIVRLVRMAKLQKWINGLYQQIDDEHWYLFAEIAKMVLMLTILSHMLACGWFWVGLESYHMNYPCWVTWSENFVEQPVFYQYISSLHWSLTQFTPASMDVVPRNLLERSFNVVVVMFAIMAFSSIVGTVTNSMTCLRALNNENNKAMWILRRFLRQRNIDNSFPGLSHRIYTYLDAKLKNRKHVVQQGSVRLLSEISDHLANQLSYSLFAETLVIHPFFKYLNDVMQMTITRICHCVINAQHYAAGDIVFHAGDEAMKAYIVNSGTASYMFRSGGRLRSPLRHGEWLGEAVLWTKWRYRGQSQTTMPTELLCTPAQKFGEAVSVHPVSWLAARDYGMQFLQYMAEREVNEQHDVLRDDHFYEEAIPKEMMCASTVEEEVQRIRNSVGSMKFTNSTRERFEAMSQSQDSTYEATYSCASRTVWKDGAEFHIDSVSGILPKQSQTSAAAAESAPRSALWSIEADEAPLSTIDILLLDRTCDRPR